MADNLHRLLHRVEVALAGIRLAEQEYAAQLAPRFLIFDYLRADEMGTSRCLADLLNPAGSHGQGRIFLDAFAKRLGTEAHVAGAVRSVELEHATDGGRRIDILLEFESGTRLAIENKPWAADQANQLADYADYLQRRAEAGKGSHWLLVYLCNTDPGDGSVDQDKRSKLQVSGNFHVMRFAGLCEALEESVGKIKALAVQVFVQEFVKFIRRDINWEASMNEQEQVTQAVLENETNLHNAFIIASSIGAVKKKLMLRLRDALQLRMADAKYAGLCLQMKSVPDYDCCWDVASDGRYRGWNIELDTGASFGKVLLRFEFDYSDYRYLFWGIPSFAKKRSDHHAAKASQVHARLAAQNLAQSGSEDHWSVWAHADTGLDLPRVWGPDQDIWARILRNADDERNPSTLILDFALRVRNILAATPPG